MIMNQSDIEMAAKWAAKCEESRIHKLRLKEAKLIMETSTVTYDEVWEPRWVKVE